MKIRTLDQKIGFVLIVGMLLLLFIILAQDLMHHYSKKDVKNEFTRKYYGSEKEMERSISAAKGIAEKINDKEVNSLITLLNNRCVAGRTLVYGKGFIVKPIKPTKKKDKICIVALSAKEWDTLLPQVKGGAGYTMRNSESITFFLKYEDDLPEMERGITVLHELKHVNDDKINRSREDDEYAAYGFDYRIIMKISGGNLIRVVDKQLDGKSTLENSPALDKLLGSVTKEGWQKYRWGVINFCWTWDQFEKMEPTLALKSKKEFLGSFAKGLK